MRTFWKYCTIISILYRCTILSPLLVSATWQLLRIASTSMLTALSTVLYCITTGAFDLWCIRSIYKQKYAKSIWIVTLDLLRCFVLLWLPFAVLLIPYDWDYWPTFWTICWASTIPQSILTRLCVSYETGKSSVSNDQTSLTPPSTGRTTRNPADTQIHHQHVTHIPTVHRVTVMPLEPVTLTDLPPSYESVGMPPAYKDVVR